jgi:hypothetical protein
MHITRNLANRTETLVCSNVSARYPQGACCTESSDPPLLMGAASAVRARFLAGPAAPAPA